MVQYPNPPPPKTNKQTKTPNREMHLGSQVGEKQKYSYIRPNVWYKY